MIAAPRKSDVFLSLGLALAEGEELQNLSALLDGAIARIDARFRFWEILVLAPETLRQTNPDLVNAVAARRNVRLAFYAPGLTLPGVMALLAQESIGDYALLCTPTEAGLLEAPEIWEHVEAGRSVLAFRERASAPSRLAAWLLGRATGYQTDARRLLGCGHARERLARLAQRFDRDIAIRYAPQPGAARIVLGLAPGAERFGAARLLRLAGAAAHMISMAAPRLLKAAALMGALAAGGGLAYALYAAALWLGGARLAQGWMTTSTAIGLSSAFISAMLSLIALGLANLLDMSRQRSETRIVSEMTRADLFREPGALNVALSGAAEKGP